MSNYAHNPVQECKNGLLVLYWYNSKTVKLISIAR